MSGPAVAWHEWLVTDAGTGRLGLRTSQGNHAGTISFAPPAPWTLSRTIWDADTIEQIWSCHAGEVRVRHALGALWHISVEQPAAGDVPGARLSLDGAPDTPTPWLWGAGSLARAVLWLPGDAGVLELRQMQGDASVVERPDGGRSLAIGAAGARTPATARWRVEPLRGWAEVAHGLPGWLPDLAVDAGDTIVLERPDAGIETDLLTDQDDLATEVTVPAGVHRIVVHEAAGPVRLDVYGAPLPSDDLRLRVARLSRLDPRTLGPAQLWLATQGSEHLDSDFVDAVAERALSLAASSPSPDAFALAAAASGLTRADPREVPDLVDDLVRAATRDPRPPVGALLARHWLARAAAVAGLPRLDLPAPPRPPGLTLAALEHAVVTQRAPQVRRLMTWALESLGRQLPGVPAEGGLGPLVCLLRSAPGRWVSDRGGVETLSLRERQASCGPDEEVAWLWL